MAVKLLRDSQRIRVYRAEEPLVLDSVKVPDISKFASLCYKMVTGLPDSFGLPKRPIVSQAPISKKIAGLAYVGYDVWRVVVSSTIPKSVIYASHEMAHLLSYRWCELNDHPWEAHGSIWTAVHQFLVWKHIDKGLSIDLRNSYSANGVRIGRFSDLI